MMLRVGVVVVGAAGFAAAVVAACSSFTASPTSGPADATADAPSEPQADTSTPPADDAGIDAAGITIADCPLPLEAQPGDLIAEDFSLSGCNGWSAIGAKIQTVKTECGMACQVCTDESASSFNVFDTVHPDASAGTYQVSGWIRSDDGDDAGVGGTGTYKIDILLYANLTGEPASPSVTGGFPSFPKWIKVTQTQTTDAGITAATPFFNGENVAAHGCFLVTNVRMTRSDQ